MPAPRPDLNPDAWKRANAADRAWLAAHPGARGYVRPVIPGEWPRFPATTAYVAVLPSNGPLPLRQPLTRQGVDKRGRRYVWDRQTGEIRDVFGPPVAVGPA
jgi:hypothetical protein